MLGLLHTRSGRLLGEVASVDRLDPETREAMWHCFSRYYEEVERAAFEADLSEKQRVILLRDSGDGSLQGFSTLKIYDLVHQGRRCVAIFSGDTIVEAAYWGQKALHRTFLRFVISQKLSRPHLPLYWFLITKGYKTYLLLARNFPEYWPRHERPTPSWEASLIDHLAREKFGDAWRPERGVLEFPRCAGKLRDGVAPLDEALLAAPDARFFAEKNPGHAGGDELCCIGKVDLRLYFAFSWKQLRRFASLTGGVARRVWAGAIASF